MELQQEFLDRMTAANKLRDDEQSDADTLDALFASLQHRAFRGEL